MLPTPPGLFIGNGPAATHNRNKRRALIMRRHRAMLARQAKAAATDPPGSKERP